MMLHHDTPPSDAPAFARWAARQDRETLHRELQNAGRAIACERRELASGGRDYAFASTIERDEHLAASRASLAEAERLYLLLAHAIRERDAEAKHALAGRPEGL